MCLARKYSCSSANRKTIPESSVSPKNKIKRLIHTSKYQVVHKNSRARISRHLDVFQLTNHHQNTPEQVGTLHIMVHRERNAVTSHRFNSLHFPRRNRRGKHKHMYVESQPFPLSCCPFNSVLPQPTTSQCAALVTLTSPYPSTCC